MPPFPRPPARIEHAAARAFLRLPAPVLRRLAGPPVASPEGFELDVQLQALLWLMRIAQEPPTEQGGVGPARERMERAAPTLDVVGVEDVVTIDRQVDGAAGKLRARLYVPKGARDPGPALVWFHGGGFVLGSLDSHDRLCRGIASRAGLVVVSVDYRLAPEHPFPAPVEDGVAATRWVLAHAAGLGIDPRAVAVGGDSAGGNLSAVVARILRDEQLRPAFQLLIYPATDLTRSMASHRHFREGFFLPETTIDWFLAAYAPDPATHTDPRASPLFARPSDLERLPAAMVITAGFDPLRDEGDAYAAKLRDAGVAVEHVCVPGMVHGFMSMAGAVREADRTLERIARSLRRALGG
jgi:acetyl esterase